MFFEQDYDEERLRADTILFWGTVGPQTGPAVVIAEEPRDLIAWLGERARVEGHSSHLARALVTVQRALEKAGTDPDTAADAIGSALEEAGIPFHACGPIERELATNDALRARLWDESSPPTGAASVLRGGETMSDVEHDPSPAPSPIVEERHDDERAYKLDEEVEDLAEHVEIDFERVDHREYLIERLEALKAPPSDRRAA